MEIMNNFNGNIDIILPLYNPNDKVFEAIRSVITQTYTNWHLYIIDDASKNTILTNIKNKYKTYTGKITYFQFIVNKRAAACRNYAIQRGDGDFIAFIDQDDVWLPGKLEQQINYFKNKNVDAVHGNIQLIDNNNIIINKGIWESENQSRREVDWNNLSKEELARKILIMPNIRIISSMVKRRAFEKIKGFKEQFFGGEDALFWFEISVNGKIGFLDEIIFKRRIHISNTTKIHKLKRMDNKYLTYQYIRTHYFSITNDIITEKSIKILKQLIVISINQKNIIKMIKYLYLLLLNYGKYYLIQG